MMERLSDSLRKKYRRPFEEERVWVDTFGEHTDRDTEEVHGIVSDYAVRIEQTLQCVAHVETVSNRRLGRLGPEDNDRVFLFVVMSRSADRELFEIAMQTISMEILDEVVR